MFYDTINMSEVPHIFSTVKNFRTQYSTLLTLNLNILKRTFPIASPLDYNAVISIHLFEENKKKGQDNWSSWEYGIIQ